MSKTEPLIFLTLENVALHTTFTIPINSKSIPLAALVKSMMLPLLHFSSVAQSCPTLCEPMDCNTPDLPVHHQLPGFTQTHVHWVGDVIQPSHHLSTLILLPSIFPSIRVFSNKSLLHIRCPKYWHFSFIISPSKEYSGLISFRIDWLDLLAVQGTLKSLLQYHSSKASILQCLAFVRVQLSHPYMTTRKRIALTRWTTKLFICWQSNVSAF